jgi:hypothetical protein
MVSILITDFFILKNDHFSESLNISNFIIWIAGFVIYRWFMAMETVFGSTLPVMAAVMILAAAAGKTKKLISGK